MITSSNSSFFENKTVPDCISEETAIALSYYPDLEIVPIAFVLKNTIKKSLMKAQPKFSTIFNSKKKRKYIIFISKKFSVDNTEVYLEQIPKKVIIGWLGHELGHIMDYRNRSGLNLLWYGIKYLCSVRYIRKAERVADSYAIQHHMKDFILATKDFILNHSGFSEKYKTRIKNLYLSPEEILTIAQAHHH